jgi:hypothetical protein
MSRHVTCDFCRGNLGRFEEDFVRVGIRHGVNEWAADLHPKCWERILEVVGLAQEFEGPLASIHVASPQGIAAKRRKHTKPDGEED